MKNKNISELLDQLQQASEGLLWMSESDYPFEVFYWKGLNKDVLTPDRLLQQTNHSPDTSVEVEDFDYFFEAATEEQDWHGSEEIETVKRYQNLVKILKENFTSLEVYRVGAIEIDVYIVGQTPSGELAGLSTKVIET